MRIGGAGQAGTASKVGGASAASARVGGSNPPGRVVRCGSAEPAKPAPILAGVYPPRYLRTPKSVVTIVTGRPLYTPAACEAWTAEMPISLQCGSSMFLRCSGLFSHIVSACCASTSGDDQRRFSPTDQKP